jgi:hypothetical protein
MRGCWPTWSGSLVGRELLGGGFFKGGGDLGQRVVELLGVALQVAVDERGGIVTLFVWRFGARGGLTAINAGRAKVARGICF